MKPEPRKPMEKIQHRLQRLCQGQAGAGVPPWKAEGPSQERSGDWRHGCFSLGIHETGQLLSQEGSKPALPTHPPHLWGAAALPLRKHGACFSTALSFIRCALTFPPREHLLESFSVSSVCCPHKPSLSHANVTWL